MLNFGQNNIWVYLFLGIFGALSSAEVILALFEKEKARKIVKPLCLAALTIAAILAFPMEYFVYVGLLCGLIGDLFFIFKEHKSAIYFGMAFFFLNHLFFVLEAFKLFAVPFDLTWTLIYVFVYLAVLVGAWFGMRYVLNMKDMKLSIPSAFYTTMLLLDVGVQFYGVFTGQHLFWICAAGGAIFALSDAILSYTLFVKDIKRRDFYIMLPYLAGQMLLVLGFFYMI